MDAGWISSAQPPIILLSGFSCNACSFNSVLKNDCSRQAFQQAVNLIYSHRFGGLPGWPGAAGGCSHRSIFAVQYIG